jgi:hypothetical protein
MTTKEEYQAAIEASIAELAMILRTTWEDEVYDWCGKDAINPNVTFNIRMEIKRRLEHKIVMALHELMKKLDEDMEKLGVGRYGR